MKTKKRKVIIKNASSFQLNKPINRRLKKIQIVSLIIALFFSLTTHAQTSSSNKKMQVLPRDLEMQLALSALPPHLRDSATVYILNPDKGFEVARKGTNGFHAFVARTGDDAMRGSWILKDYREDVLYPVSFDDAGAKAQMQVFFDIAAMQAKGMPAEEVKKTIQERYKTNYYKAPERPGVSYMLSPILRTYTNPEQNDSIVTLNFPHVMYYAPNMQNDEIGGTTPAKKDIDYLLQHGKWEHSPYPFIIMPGAHGFMIQARGDEERVAITKEYKDMLAKLCAIRKDWCLIENQSSAPPQHHH